MGGGDLHQVTGVDKSIADRDRSGFVTGQLSEPAQLTLGPPTDGVKPVDQRHQFRDQTHLNIASAKVRKLVREDGCAFGSGPLPPRARQ